MSEDAAVDLIRALVENMRRAEDEWESLAMVIEISDGEARGTYGYVYAPGGVISAVSARPSRIEPAVNAYIESYYKPGDTLPVKLLVQFDRTKGEYEITFEDTDTSRWEVTPANIDVIRDQLHPRFDE